MLTWRRGSARFALAAGIAAALAAGIAPALGATAPAAKAPAAANVRPAAWPSPAASPSGWTLRLAIQYLTGADHSKYLAVVAGRRQAWFFGGSDIGGHGVPEIERRTGGRWVPVPLSSIPGLHSWIAAASAASANDIWAVTSLGGAVLHWDGRTWAAASRGGWLAGTQFTGISAVAPGSVWLFGTRGKHHPGAGTWHWDGTRWTRVRGIAGGIRQASAASAAGIWAIGRTGGTMSALFRLGGGSWHRLAPRALAGFRYSDVVAFSPVNVWVAGSVAGTPKLGHFNGTGWTRLAMPGRVAATGICRNGRGGLWVIANPGTGQAFVRQRSAAGRWSKAGVSQSQTNRVLACALVPGTRAAWGAGQAEGLRGMRGTAAAVYGFGRLP